MRKGIKIQFQRQFARARDRVSPNIFSPMQGEITKADRITLQTLFVDPVSSIVRPVWVEGDLGQGSNFRS